MNIRLEASEQEADLRLFVIDYSWLNLKTVPVLENNYAESHIFPRNKQNLLAVIRRADQARLSHNFLIVEQQLQLINTEAKLTPFRNAAMDMIGDVG